MKTTRSEKGFEEKAHQDARKTAIKGKNTANKPSKPASSPIVPNVFDLSTKLTSDDIKRINKITYTNPTVSLYLTFTAESTLGAPGQEKKYHTAYNSLKHSEWERRKEYIDSLSHTQRENLKQDIDSIEAYLKDHTIGHGVKTLVIFKSNQELHMIINLPVLLKDTFVIDVNAYTSPIEGLLQEQKHYLLAHITHMSSQFYLYNAGKANLVHEIKTDIPVNKVDASRPEKVQRHRLEYIDKHYKESAQYIASQLLNHTAEKLIITSDEAATSKKFESFLTEDVLKKLIGTYRLPAKFDKKQIASVITEAITQSEALLETNAFAKLEAAAGKNGVIHGIKEIIEAQNRFLIRQLYVAANATQAGYMCPTHRFLSVKAGSCPSCNKKLVSTKNLFDELIELARLQSMELYIFSQNPELMQKYDQIAAISFK